MKKVTLFHVNIEQAVLDDLKRRILATRFNDSVPGTPWEYGPDPSYLKELATYWANDFDWRKAETAMNMYPHFIAETDGYKIHFLHIKSKNPAAVPLIISHGWPGSFLEMLPVIPLLTDTFHLVIPSLPGFGFSDKPKDPGVNAGFIAALWVKLMDQLGYPQFVAQGGDFGAFISIHMAMKYPERLLALHLNYIPFSYKPHLAPGEDLTPEEKDALQKIDEFFKREGGYAQIQSTKPGTLSYGLNDSPMGLCAWLLQIFHSFSDPSKPLEELFKRDELLAHVSLYWITQTIYSSMPLYPEIAKEPLGPYYIKVPTGVAHYPFPEGFPARKYVERQFNLQYWNDLPTGGHFAAMEQPALFAGDVKAFVKQLLL